MFTCVSQAKEECEQLLTAVSRPADCRKVRMKSRALPAVCSIYTPAELETVDCQRTEPVGNAEAIACTEMADVLPWL